MSSVALVVPFHNEIDRLPLVVRALRRQAPHAVEIVFLDNASDDGSLRFVRGLEEIEAKDWHLFSEKRVGKFHAMRSATERCEQQLGASIVGFLDADSYPTNGAWLYQADRIGVELPDRLGFIHSPCNYYELEAWPCFGAACTAYHDVISDLSTLVGWFPNAAGGFFSLRLLKRYFEIAEPTSELGLRISLLGLWLGLEGRHNPGAVKTSARRIIRDAVSFTRWCTYSRDFYLCKDINRTRKIDLRHRCLVPDLSPDQVKTFFRRQAVKMSSRVLVPMELLDHSSEPTRSMSSAIGVPDRCLTEARLASLRISPEMLVTPRFERLMHRIEHSTLCRRVADAVEQLLRDAYETNRRNSRGGLSRDG